MRLINGSVKLITMSTLRERQLSKFPIFCFDIILQHCDENCLVFFTDALKQMLNLNQPLTKSLATEPGWKVLIYDRVGQDIISPLLSVKDLRELGVTLHV